MIGLLTPFLRRPRQTVLAIDPEEQRILGELNARRAEARKRAAEDQSQ